jgi:hypothetical protein
MKGIHATINKGVKAPIKLDWRIEHYTDDSEITELGSTHAPPPADGDVTGMSSDYVDKCTRRKPTARSLDSLWGIETGIKYKLVPNFIILIFGE